MLEEMNGVEWKARIRLQRRSLLAAVWSTRGGAEYASEEAQARRRTVRGTTLESMQRGARGSGRILRDCICCRRGFDDPQCSRIE